MREKGEEHTAVNDYYFIDGCFISHYINISSWRFSMRRRHRHHSRHIHLLLLIPVMALLISGIAAIFLYSCSPFPENHGDVSLTPNPPQQITGIHSRQAILTLPENNAPLAVKAPDERIYPASMTKLMSALVAVSQIEDLNVEIEMTKTAYQAMLAEGASMSGFLPGERASVRNFLCGCLLPSGGDCCICLAEYVSGSEDKFVAIMNRKAEILGMTETHFTNTTGLHDDAHYSTVRDISILLQAVLQNPELYDILTSKTHVVPPTNRHPEGFTMHSTMFQYLAGSDLSSGHILGGKTGYTSIAGQCLASFASVNGSLYILVTAGAFPPSAEEHWNTEDALDIYNRYSK